VNPGDVPPRSLLPRTDDDDFTRCRSPVCAQSYPRRARRAPWRSVGRQFTAIGGSANAVDRRQPGVLAADREHASSAARPCFEAGAAEDGSIGTGVERQADRPAAAGADGRIEPHGAAVRAGQTGWTRSKPAVAKLAGARGFAVRKEPAPAARAARRQRPAARAARFDFRRRVGERFAAVDADRGPRSRSQIDRFRRRCGSPSFRHRPCPSGDRQPAIMAGRPRRGLPYRPHAGRSRSRRERPSSGKSSNSRPPGVVRRASSP
jgi:hypothetical protein